MSQKQNKPNLSHSQASEMMTRLYALTPSKIRTLASYADQNFYVATAEGSEYVLKIMNVEDSENHMLLEVQTHAMSFLHQKGLPAQTVVPNSSGQAMSLEEIDCGFGCQKYMVRLLTYLPGTTVSPIHLTPKLLYAVGQTAAGMDIILNEMDHPHLSVLQRENFIWSLSGVPLMESYLWVLDGDPLQDILKSIIHQYKTTVANKYSQFRKGVIQGDFNNLNMLVLPDENGGHRISGILDFGDMHMDFWVHELAITIMYMMTEHPEPMEVGRPILTGWESLLPLNEAEKESLYVLVLCRFCQSLLYARYYSTLQPENVEYLMISSKRGIKVIKELWELGKEAAEKVWFQSASGISDRN